MGWRAVMRSWAAAERRAAREQERALKRQRRAAEKRMRRRARTEDDYGKAVAALEAAEAKAVRTPIRGLGFKFLERGGWLSDPVTSRARTTVPYELQVRVDPQQVTFEPPTVDFGDFSIAPLACGISRFGTFLAFSATTDKAAAKLDLTNMSTPQNSRVLVGDGAERLYAPTDDDVDGTVVRGYARVGTVTFEPFDEPLHEFTVLLVPRARKDGDEPVTMRVAGPGLHAAIARALEEPSLAETFEDEVAQAVEQAEAERADRQRRGAMSRRARALGGSGAAGLVLPAVGVLGAAVVLMAFLGGGGGTSSNPVRQDGTASAPQVARSSASRSNPSRPTAMAPRPAPGPTSPDAPDAVARRAMARAADLARLGDFPDAIDTLRETRTLRVSRDVEREIGRLIALYVERRTDEPPAAGQAETAETPAAASPASTVQVEVLVVTLKSGRTVEGVLVRDDPAEVVVRTGGGAIGVAREYVASVERVVREQPAPPVAASRTGPALPSLSVWLHALVERPGGREARQIPATVVDAGPLRHVPYVSHRAGKLEMNVYGDPDAPACVEIGIVAHAPMTPEAKAHCRAFVEAVLSDPEDVRLVQALPNVGAATRERSGLTFEVTPPEAPDAYGGWWISVYSVPALDAARLEAHQVQDLTVHEEDLAHEDPAEPLAWRPADVHSARPAVGGGGRTVYVRGYTRRDGTYVRPHTRSAPGSRSGGGGGRRGGGRR